MIRVRTFLACLALLFLPEIASAQITFYGTLSCNDAHAQSGAIASVKTSGRPAGSVSGKAAGPHAAGLRGKAKPQPQPAAIADNKADPAPAAFVEECSWTLPMQIGNDTAQGGENTFNASTAGSQSGVTGTHTGHMTNSDQFTMSLSGTTVLDGNGAVRSRQGSWTFASGTGMLKGITGGGTYSGQERAEGGITYDVEGEYDFPKPPAPVPAGTPIPSTPPAAGTSPKAISPS